MGKSNFLKTFSRGKLSPYFQKGLIVALYITFIFMSCYCPVSAAPDVQVQEEQGQEDNKYLDYVMKLVSPDVPYVDSVDSDVTNQLTSINYRLDDIEKDFSTVIDKADEIIYQLELLNSLLSLVLGSITLVIIVVGFLLVCKWLYKYLKF